MAQYVNKNDRLNCLFRQFECCYFKLDESFQQKVNILRMTSLFGRQFITEFLHFITLHNAKLSYFASISLVFSQERDLSW